MTAKKQVKFKEQENEYFDCKLLDKFDENVPAASP